MSEYYYKTVNNQNCLASIERIKAGIQMSETIYRRMDDPPDSNRSVRAWDSGSDRWVYAFYSLTKRKWYPLEREWYQSEPVNLTCWKEIVEEPQPPEEFR